MVVDSSVLVAIVLGESDAESLLGTLQAADRVHLSAASAIESAIVVEARQGPDAARDLHLLLEGAGIAVHPVDAAQVPIAVAAWRRFGKGRHPAGLNLGDCFSYALAKVLAEPLLFKGDDFAQTDLVSARA
jgi:ribonuclease VapC